MRRLGVRRAFTFDPDFGVEGFEVLPGELTGRARDQAVPGARGRPGALRARQPRRDPLRARRRR